MKRLILLALLALASAACSSGYKTISTGDEEPAVGVYYWHDVEHHVSCWTSYQSSISCLPDSQVHLP